ASGDGDFCGTLDGIRRRGKEVVVWSVRTATRAELTARANRHEWIEDFLNLNMNPVERPMRPASPTLPPSTPMLPDEFVSQQTERAPRVGPAPVITDPTSASRLCSWVRLGYFLEKTLRENQWNKIAFKRLAAMLAELDEFGPTPANSMMWLNRA